MHALHFSHVVMAMSVAGGRPVMAEFFACRTPIIDLDLYTQVAPTEFSYELALQLVGCIDELRGSKLIM